MALEVSATELKPLLPVLEVLAPQWLLCLFVGAMPPDAVARIWDQMFWQLYRGGRGGAAEGFTPAPAPLADGMNGRAVLIWAVLEILAQCEQELLQTAGVSTLDTEEEEEENGEEGGEEDGEEGGEPSVGQGSCGAAGNDVGGSLVVASDAVASTCPRKRPKRKRKRSQRAAAAAAAAAGASCLEADQHRLLGPFVAILRRTAKGKGAADGFGSSVGEASKGVSSSEMGTVGDFVHGSALRDARRAATAETQWREAVKEREERGKERERDVGWNRGDDCNEEDYGLITPPVHPASSPTDLPPELDLAVGMCGVPEQLVGQRDTAAVEVGDGEGVRAEAAHTPLTLVHQAAKGDSSEARPAEREGGKYEKGISLPERIPPSPAKGVAGLLLLATSPNADGSSDGSSDGNEDANEHEHTYGQQQTRTPTSPMGSQRSLGSQSSSTATESTVSDLGSSMSSSGMSSVEFGTAVGEGASSQVGFSRRNSSGGGAGSKGRGGAEKGEKEEEEGEWVVGLEASGEVDSQEGGAGSTLGSMLKRLGGERLAAAADTGIGAGSRGGSRGEGGGFGGALSAIVTASEVQVFAMEDDEPRDDDASTRDGDASTGSGIGDPQSGANRQDSRLTHSIMISRNELGIGRSDHTRAQQAISNAGHVNSGFRSTAISIISEEDFEVQPDLCVQSYTRSLTHVRS
jgi:hypothetical protein